MWPCPFPSGGSCHPCIPSLSVHSTAVCLAAQRGMSVRLVIRVSASVRGPTPPLHSYCPQGLLQRRGGRGGGDTLWRHCLRHNGPPPILCSVCRSRGSATACWMHRQGCGLYPSPHPTPTALGLQRACGNPTSPLLLGLLEPQRAWPVSAPSVLPMSSPVPWIHPPSLSHCEGLSDMFVLRREPSAEL